MSKIIDVESNFDEFISSGVAVVDFWATWCGPCRMLAPIMEQVASNLVGAKFGKVDIDKATELANRYQITAIPNVCIFKDGKLVDRIIGLSDEAEIVQTVNKYLN